MVGRIAAVANDKELPVVVHFAERFVVVTQNWIYHQVVRTARYRPVVATEVRENEDQFRFDPVLFPEQRRTAYRLLCAHSVRSGRRRLNRLVVPLQVVSRAYEQPVRRARPAVLHAHFGTQAVHLLRLRRRLRVPLVTTFYGFDASSIPRLPGWRVWYRRLFKRGDRFLVEGSAFRKRLLDLGCPAEKAAVHHLGVDIDTIPFSRREVIPGEPVRLLMAASFREKKGHEYALRAFAVARSRMAGAAGRPRAELRLIGDGELRPKIESLIRDLRLGDSVRLLGMLPHTAFLEETHRSHLFLAPSVTAADGDTEGGAPVSLIEAAATGMPAVAFRHADIPEVVRHGETGWLAPERNVEALADHLFRLLQHPEQWPALGTSARQHVEAEYNLSVQARRLDAIYDELRANAA